MTTSSRPGIDRRRTPARWVAAVGVVVFVLLGLSGRASAGPDAPGSTKAHYVLVSAHRGGSMTVPNSMAAFKAAVRNGVREIEADSWVLSGGHATAVYHDAAIGPECNHWVGRKLRGLTARQVSVIRCNGEPIPSVHQLVSFVAGTSVRLRLEVKTFSTESSARLRREARVVVQRVVNAGIVGRTTMQSFRWRSFLGFLNGAPRIRISALDASPSVSDARLAARLGAYDLSYPGRMSTESLVGAVHGLGLGVAVYQVNNGDLAASLRQQGVDVIITDHPVRIRRKLGE